MFVIKLILKIISGIVGLFFVLLGLTAFVFEIVVIAAGNGLASQALGRVWFQNDPLLDLLHSPSIQLAQVVVERKLGIPWLWSPGITTILNWPSWLALVVVGVVGLTIGIILLSFLKPRRRLDAPQ